MTADKKSLKLRALNAELAKLKEKANQLELHWNNEKNIISQRQRADFHKGQQNLTLSPDNIRLSRDPPGC